MDDWDHWRGVRWHDIAFLDATCRVEQKRGHVRALQSRIPNAVGAICRMAHTRCWAMTEIKLGRTPSTLRSSPTAEDGHSFPRRSKSPRRNAVKTGAKTGACRTRTS